MTDYKALSIVELDKIIADAQAAREILVEARKAELLAELEALTGKPASNSIEPARQRAKAKPKYQSKRDPNIVWSGKGAMAKWMVAEIEEGLGKTKEDFLIAA